jgi:hypothetical protein
VIHIHLGAATRAELQSLRRSARASAIRDRLEMLLRSDAGWSAPRIAAPLGYDPQTVRKVLHGWRRDGRAILSPARPGPRPDTSRRDTILGHRTDLLGQDRTWASAQPADALRPHGLTLGGRQVRRYLGQLQSGYRRTASTLKHKQDPAKFARAQGVRGGVKTYAQAGRLKLCYLDQSGFRPSLPSGVELVPARPAQAGLLRIPAGAAGERAGEPRPVRAGAVAGRRGLRADADQ